MFGRLIPLFQLASDSYCHVLILRQQMEYCCYIWTETVQFSYSSLEGFRNHSCIFVGEDLISILQRLSVGLLYRYFRGKCSEERFRKFSFQIQVIFSISNKISFQLIYFFPGTSINANIVFFISYKKIFHKIK